MVVVVVVVVVLVVVVAVTVVTAAIATASVIVAVVVIVIIKVVVVVVVAARRPAVVSVGQRPGASEMLMSSPRQNVSHDACWWGRGRCGIILKKGNALNIDYRSTATRMRQYQL